MVIVQLYLYTTVCKKTVILSYIFLIVIIVEELCR